MMIHLPEDMAKDILSRLPVKSILRFRSVSKSWLSLISRTDFVSLQLKRAYDVPFHEITISNGKNCRLRSVGCSSSNTFDNLSTSRLLQLPFYTGLRFIILGCSNGLLCLSTYTYGHIYLWNPCTNVYKKLPDLEYLQAGAVDRYGFGYDSSSDDYKLLIVNAATINIFSWKRGAWKCIQDVKYANGYRPDRKCGVLVNEVVHWAYKDYRNSVSHHWILSFGLANESFSEFPLPDLPSGDLGVLGGFLCFCVCALGGYAIWIMKEYGVSSSWRQLTNKQWSYIEHDVRKCSPLCFPPDKGVIILQRCGGGDLASFITERKSLKTLTRRYPYSDAAVYVETLISPNNLNATNNEETKSCFRNEMAKTLLIRNSESIASTR